MKPHVPCTAVTLAELWSTLCVPNTGVVLDFLNITRGIDYFGKKESIFNIKKFYI